jgi:hypothetical protein
MIDDSHEPAGEAAARGAALIAAAVAAPEARAPLSLRAQIEAERTRASRRPTRRRAWIAVPVSALAAAVIAVVLATGGASGPSITQVAAVGVRPPTGPAPAVTGGALPRLDLEVGGVAFPEWREAFEWKAVGRRTDVVDERRVTTVAYETAEGRRVDYSIVAGAALEPPDDAREVTRNGTTYRLLDAGDRRVVTWERGGRTCVVSAEGVPDERLLAAAEWSA